VLPGDEAAVVWSGAYWQEQTLAIHRRDGSIRWQLQSAPGQWFGKCVFDPVASELLLPHLTNEEEGHVRVNRLSLDGEARGEYGLPGDLLLGVGSRGDLVTLVSSAQGEQRRSEPNLGFLGGTWWGLAITRAQAVIRCTRAGQVLARASVPRLGEYAGYWGFSVCPSGAVFAVGIGVNPKTDVWWWRVWQLDGHR
jgi:hypothetical protein